MIANVLELCAGCDPARMTEINVGIVEQPRATA